MTLLARVAPPILFGSRRAGLLIERNLMVYRRGWLVIVSGFFEPLFYLLSIGLGMALAARVNRQDYFTYVIVGDGEIQEGIIWEAAMAASGERPMAVANSGWSSADFRPLIELVVPCAAGAWKTRAASRSRPGTREPPPVSTTPPLR